MSNILLLQELAETAITVPCKACGVVACDFHRGWVAGAAAAIEALLAPREVVPIDAVLDLCARWYAVEGRWMTAPPGKGPRVSGKMPERARKARAMAAAILHAHGYTYTEMQSIFSCAKSHVASMLGGQSPDAITYAAVMHRLGLELEQM